MPSREDTVIKIKALKGREYGTGVTRCCQEEFYQTVSNNICNEVVDFFNTFLIHDIYLLIQYV